MKHVPFRGLGAILFKEFIIVWRDPMTLFFMFFPPLVEMIAFGYALDTDVKHMAMMILNEDRTVESRQFIDRFVNTETFRVVGEVRSIDELASEIRRGRAYVGLEIPPTFTRDVRAGNPAQVQLLVDGSNSTTALQALNTALAVGLTQSVETLLRETGRRSVPIEIRPQMLYNPAMKSPNFYIPGVIGIVLQIGTTFATAMAVVREREKGTLETLLVSPLSRWGLMLGKLVPYLCIGMTMAVILFLIMRFLFGVPINGSVTAMMFATLVYVFALLSLGLLVATKAENQMQALQMSMVFMLPSVFFSGFVFPRETMPQVFYALSTILPATYFISLMRAIILRGAHLFRILAASRHPDRHFDFALLCLRAALSKEDRINRSPDMKFTLVALLFLMLVGLTAIPGSGASISCDEHIVITGGVSLWEWEKDKPQPHDHWWLNFIRASRLRIEQMQQEYGGDARITWLVFAPSYRRRELQEKKNLFSVIDSIPARYGVKLIYFDNADQFCAYLDRGQDRVRCKIASLDYFGHSNQDCMMFDYSNEVGSASKVWLHQSELKGKLRRGIFTRHALIKSWGCFRGKVSHASGIKRLERK